MRFTKGDLIIEMSEISQIKGGVEVFARAWKDGKQLGFGDGTLETERFRIFTPPKLVPDESGSIVKQWENSGGTVTQTFREDPEQAIKEVVAHNILLLGRSDKEIVIGSVGNTTDTFFPAAGANTPIDGQVRNQGSGGALYSTIQGAASGTTADVVGDTLETNNLLTGGNYRIYRTFILFDTSSILTDVITSASLSVFGTGSGNADSDSVRLVTTTPAATNTLATSDFSNVGTVAQASDIGIGSWSTIAYNTFTLNATGVGNINKSGITKFGMRLVGDVNATQPAGVTFIDGNSADHTGTSQDPKLVVVHSIAQGGSFLFKLI